MKPNELADQWRERIKAGDVAGAQQTIDALDRATGSDDQKRERYFVTIYFQHLAAREFFDCLTRNDTKAAEQRLKKISHEVAMHLRAFLEGNMTLNHVNGSTKK